MVRMLGFFLVATCWLVPFVAATNDGAPRWSFVVASAMIVAGFWLAKRGHLLPQRQQEAADEPRA